jgi:hypothetical protein
MDIPVSSMAWVANAQHRRMHVKLLYLSLEENLEDCSGIERKGEKKSPIA